jgi:maltose alpha-D-glucosyltransferase/alpha-amylase
MLTNSLKSARPRRRVSSGLPRDPEWYRTAVIYEVHVRAFADSNGDGIGDFPGLTSRLDYLQDLGVTALWLLPFYPSPLRDGGYDIADYSSINPSYGTMDDFRRLLDEAHARGLRVITELVINHTSADHEWFQRARRAPPGSPERDFYVWSETPDRYTGARIIFKDFETSNWAWDPVAKAYYWHRFYSHQPDLNFDNPAVHVAVETVLDQWLGMGVDGLRLDAVPYLYEREGTNCENLKETHAYLKKLRAHVDAKFADKMLLAEANQWPIDAASYFGDGDECHMNFNFPLMPRMFMAVQMEDRFPIVDIVRQTPATPGTCQWAIFLRNHDELTLEMVTDEERDYMYQTYTEDPVARINLGIRRRLAPLLRSRRKIELMNALLFSLPGTPVIYYGDEIGMGDNVYLGDRDGVRTPMQWSGDRNAGFSRANPQRLYLPVIVDPEYHYESVNVEAQEGNPTSLLWWMKRLIALRAAHPALGRGDFQLLQPDNPKVLAFVRGVGEDRVLVVANLSRFPQHAEIDLTHYAGAVPVEAFGRSAFPAIAGDRRYPLSFGPHAFYWFVLEQPAAHTGRGAPTLRVATWTDLVGDTDRLARLLAAYATERRWFRGKARRQQAASVNDVVEMTHRYGKAQLVVFTVSYTEGASETYLVPLSFATGEPAALLAESSPHAVIAHLETDAGPGVLYDALATGEAAAAIFDGLCSGTTLSGEVGRLTFQPAPGFLAHCGSEPLAPRAVRLEQTNSTVPFGDRLLVKVFRQLEPGANAEVEVGTFLAERGRPGLAPRVLGTASYTPPGGEPAAVAIVHAFVANQGTAWELFLGHLQALFDQVLPQHVDPPPTPALHLFDLAAQPPPAALAERVPAQLRHARLLGQRTGEVHATLATGTSPAFAPERFTMMHQQSLFQSARSLLARVVETLATNMAALPEETRGPARALIAAQPAVEARLRIVTDRLIEAARIRPHGDLHLGQVLYTGDDFVLIDFEGEPARPLRERRYKRNPLRDVAGMLRSFSYAAESGLRDGRQRAQDLARLRPWASAWTAWMGAQYLAGYLELASGLLAPRDEDRRLLLDFYRIDKCIYEIAYELNNRPAWLPIPVAGLLELAGVA